MMEESGVSILVVDMNVLVVCYRLENRYTNVKQGYHFKANYFSDPCLLHERFFGNMSSRFSQNAQL